MIKIMVLIASVFLGSAAFANPSDDVLADCSQFRITTSLIVNVSEKSAVESLSIEYPDQGYELHEATAAQRKLVSKSKNSKLYLTSVDADVEIYVELSGEVVQTFTYSSGTKSEVETCQ